MKKQKYMVSWSILLGCILLCAKVGSAQLKHKDDTLYENIFTIKGKVEIVDHPEFGKTEGNSFSFILQRVGCKKCFIVVKTNKDGSYGVTVGRGKYRIVAREARGGGEPSYDLLVSNQPRIIDVSNGNRIVEFNIKVKFPDN